MYDDRSRRHAAQTRRPRHSRMADRPDRVALWAVIMAVIAMLAAAASSQAGGGGAGPAGPESEESGVCDNTRFGKRTLSRGDCGRDVKTLNWLLNSKRYADAAPLGKRYRGTTEGSVESFQQRKDLPTTGTLNRRTKRKLARSMRKDVATWYGPGFWGNRTACGVRLKRRTVGVAHKRLPCGTKVTLKYKGRYLRTRVIDRGPYAHGARWDLTKRAAKKLRFEYTDELRSAPIR